MLLEFIASIALGLGVAGLLMLFNRLSPKALPAFLLPASAGLAMIAMMVYLEYSWAKRTIDNLPQGVVVTAQSSERMWYRPWTYLKPLSLRMVAVDTRRNRTNEQWPDQVMTTVVLFGRWLPAREIPVVYDCANATRADLEADVRFSAEGGLVGADWRPLTKDDPALMAACATIKP